jgi:hypothetical protein
MIKCEGNAETIPGLGTDPAFPTNTSHVVLPSSDGACSLINKKKYIHTYIIHTYARTRAREHTHTHTNALVLSVMF